MSLYQVHQFANGIRMVHYPVAHSRVVHCGFIIDVGSRDEQPHQLGLAHFWEHMAFKGTKKRSAYKIINSLETVGGELNAYTTKEKICFYASVLDKHYAKAIDLLTDITFFSIFPEKQIERERNVILEEMAMYLDTPEDAIQDDFEAAVFRNHSLGNNILGTQESVHTFLPQDFREFMEQNLHTERIIFSVVGNIAFQKAVQIAERYLTDIPRYNNLLYRQPFTTYQPANTYKNVNIMQAHCAIGRTAYPIRSAHRVPFFILNNLLGGPAMNSRLNMALREKNGLVYSVDSSFTSYSDTGLWAIYFATEKKQFHKAYLLVRRELENLCHRKLTITQLHQAKQQLIGQLLIAEENYVSLMLVLAKSLLDLERIEPLETVLQQIEAVSADQILEVANEMFDPKALSMLSYSPENN